MTMREFVDLMCIALKEEYSIEVVKVILRGFSTCDPIEMYLIKPDDEDSEKSENRLKSYLRTGRNISRDFARALIDECEHENVVRYLKDTFYDEDDIDSLCHAFEPVCPEINSENAFDSVADLFRKMLVEASQMKHSVPKSTSKVKIHLSGKERKEILEMIEDVIFTLDNLEDDMLRRYEKPPRMALHEQLFHFSEHKKDFREINEELQKFNVLHPELTLLKKLYELYKNIKYTTQIVKENGQQFIEFEPSFKEYCGTVRDLMEVLTTFDQ